MLPRTWFGPDSPHNSVDDAALTRPRLPEPGSAEAARQVPEPRESGVEQAARLVVHRGPDVGAAYPLSAQRTVIGRHRDSDIVLDDFTVSRTHVEIHREDERFVLVDCGSLNGTYLNRNPVDLAELNEGDEVWVGRIRFTFRTA